MLRPSLRLPKNKNNYKEAARRSRALERDN